MSWGRSLLIPDTFSFVRRATLQLSAAAHKHSYLAPLSWASGTRSAVLVHSLRVNPDEASHLPLWKRWRPALLYFHFFHAASAFLLLPPGNRPLIISAPGHRVPSSAAVIGCLLNTHCPKVAGLNGSEHSKIRRQQ